MLGGRYVNRDRQSIAKLLNVAPRLPHIASKLLDKKSSLKHIHDGSCFEELIARNVTMKIELNFDTQFKNCSLLVFME